MKCRNCQKKLNFKWIDLGNSPPSNNYIKKKDFKKKEKKFPLKVYVCKKCWLAQTWDYARAEDLFKKDYAYFSSTSKTFLKHAKDYTDKIIKKLKLNNKSKVIEIASNDGYLLKNFKKKNIPCIGIEPTIDTANFAEKLGIKVIKSFFNSKLAKNLTKDQNNADLIIGNNVYAHVPDICDFTKGIEILLKENGTVTLEFPHLLKLIKYNQFDTVYHEHFSYLSLSVVKNIFQKNNLKIYNVEEIKTHGGSLRVYGCKKKAKFSCNRNVKKILDQEISFGLKKIDTYKKFQKKIDAVKYEFLKFLNNEKNKNKKICGYGAAAKGNTLINYCNIKNNIIDFICDASPYKQNMKLPGSKIPIYSPYKIKEKKPDYIIILPWNLSKEIQNQLSYIKKWNGKFVTVIPKLKIL